LLDVCEGINGKLECKQCGLAVSGVNSTEHLLYMILKINIELLSKFGGA